MNTVNYSMEISKIKKNKKTVRKHLEYNKSLIKKALGRAQITSSTTTRKIMLLPSGSDMVF